MKSLDPDKLERLGRYEVHPQPKALNWMLAMLLRLKDLRARGRSRADPFRKTTMAVATRRLFGGCGARGSQDWLLQPASRDRRVGFNLD